MVTQFFHWITTATALAAALAAALSLTIEAAAPQAGPATAHIAAAWQPPTL
jgi:hypothetical protein